MPTTRPRLAPTTRLFGLSRDRGARAAVLALGLFLVHCGSAPADAARLVPISDRPAASMPAAQVPAEPPPPPALPATHLQFAWKRRVAIAASLPNGSLVVSAPTSPYGYSIIDGSTGNLLVPLAEPPRVAAGTSVWQVAGAHLGVVVDGDLYGIEPSSGRVTWTASETSLLPLDAESVPPKDLFLVGDGTHAAGIDAETGARRWTMAAPTSATWSTRGDILFADTTSFDHAIRAFSLVDGRPLWTRTVEGGRYACAFDERFAVAYGFEGDMHVFDAATGAIVARYDVADLARATVSMMLFRGTLIAVGIDGISAREPKSGKELWTRPERMSRVVVGDDALFISSPRGLLAVDADNTVLWNEQVGAYSAGRLALVPGLEGGEGVTFTDGAGDTTAFMRLPDLAPPSTVTVTGTLRVDGKPAPGITVFAGDLSVRTDAAGGFQFEITTRTEFEVHPAFAELPPPQEPTQFPCCGRTARGTSSVTVQPEAGKAARIDFDLTMGCGTCKP
ncbi:MAG: PQQ-binding-like beta-propeller repeat protein [Polyangiaceae bacterium]